MLIPKNENRIIVRPQVKSETIIVEAGASLVYIFFLDQLQKEERKLEFILQGTSATARVLGFAIGDRGKSLLRIRMSYQGAYTTGFTWIKSVLGGSASSNVHGMIRMEKGAVAADGYFTHNTLLISNHAQGKTSPSLEIEEHEVKASHSATVGYFDAEVLFYLQSRGIKTNPAKKLVMTSFAREYLTEIPDSRIRTRCEALLTKKLSAL